MPRKTSAQAVKSEQAKSRCVGDRSLCLSASAQVRTLIGKSDQRCETGGNAHTPRARGLRFKSGPGNEFQARNLRTPSLKARTDLTERPLGVQEPFPGAYRARSRPPRAPHRLPRAASWLVVRAGRGGTPSSTDWCGEPAHRPGMDSIAPTSAGRCARTQSDLCREASRPGTRQSCAHVTRSGHG